MVPMSGAAQAGISMTGMRFLRRVLGNPGYYQNVDYDSNRGLGQGCASMGIPALAYLVIEFRPR